MSSGDIVVRVLKKTWWESVKDAVKNGWKKFVGVVFGFLESLAALTGVSTSFLALEGSAARIPGSQLGSIDAIVGKFYKIT